MYADDTCLTASTIDPEMLQFKLKHDLEVVRSWLHVNKLITLNIKKTKYLIIASNYRLNQMKRNFEINVHDQSLSRVGSYGYLGIVVDETLSWQTQVDTMVRKVSAGLGVSKKVYDFLPCQTLVRIYEALVLPYFDYCSEVWGSLGKHLSDRLQK